MSRIQTYNLAYGGATVDSALIAPYTPTVLSLKDQINTEFVPGYTGSNPTAPSAPKWTAKDSLFTIWIGINDVGTLFWQSDTTLFDKVFVQYASLVDTLYAKGARNIAFIDVPPMDRSPGYMEAGTWNVEQGKIAVAAWKSRMASLAANLKKSKPDANVFIYSSAADFGKALDNPAAFKQTAGLKVLDKYCKDYQKYVPFSIFILPSLSLSISVSQGHELITVVIKQWNSCERHAHRRVWRARQPVLLARLDSSDISHPPGRGGTVHQDTPSRPERLLGAV